MRRKRLQKPRADAKPETNLTPAISFPPLHLEKHEASAPCAKINVLFTTMLNKKIYMYSDNSMPRTLSSRSPPVFVCQIGKLKPQFRLVEEEDSTTFRDNQHKFQMTAAVRQKEESQAPPPSLRLCCSPLILLIAPQVKICCSHQFDSISDDAATRSLFPPPPPLSLYLFPPSFGEQD